MTVALFHVAVLVLIFLYLDYPAYKLTFHMDKHTNRGVLGIFRAMGRWPGVLLCIFVFLGIRSKRWVRIVLTLMIACGMMAVFSDILSRCVCRERPRHSHGLTVFRPAFSRLTESGNAGASFSSGDVTTAFALATVLTAAAPGAWWVFFALATGTAYWRLSNGSHFASDAYFSAVVAYYGTTFWLILFRCLPRRAPPGESPATPGEETPAALRGR